MEYGFKFGYIIAVIGIIFFTIDYFKIFSTPQLVLPSINRDKKNSSIRIFIYLLGLMFWVFLGITVMNPRLPDKFVPGDIEVNDIFLVVDVSRSMLAQDLKPNRLEVAKNKLEEFVSLRPTDRIGVIIFSEKVFTLLPLTTDPELVRKIIGDIQIGFLGSGTNIGDALALAVARGIQSSTKNKVIVLLTDGVNNVGNMAPLEAAKLAKENNIKVYTIGLGGSKDAKLPVSNGVFGTQYQNIPGGSIDKKSLQEISDLTGGKTYMAGSENSLSEILNDIQKLEKTKIKNQGQIIYKELYYNYLIISLMFLMLYLVGKRFILKEYV